jgi:hypothetical protein
MASRIQRGVGKHRYPDKFYAVQNAPGHIAASTASAGLPAAIDLKSQFVGFVTAAGCDGVIGANHIAHGASDTVVSRVGFLPNAIVSLVNAGRRFQKADRRLNVSFAKNAELDGIDGAYGRAFTAQGTFFLVPQNLPGQILDA